MPWITPKTDWQVRKDATGAIIGDYVNIEDYNRIKNNLLYLRELVIEFLKPVPVIPVSADKTYADYYYADEFNQIEDGLKVLQDTINIWNFGPKQTFNDNGKFISYTELNRIESAELTIYESLINSMANRRRLSFTVGNKAGVLRV